tara:strand:- start:672 stop:1295 length:624 start_codon:yes stop_codon:yes gene_type:complete
MEIKINIKKQHLIYLCIIIAISLGLVAYANSGDQSHSVDEILFDNSIPQLTISGDLTVGGTISAGGFSIASLAMPSGAVMAFDAESCPADWSEFTLANGRVIVGQLENDADFGGIEQIGGERSQRLTTNQIPSHSHTLTDIGHAHLTQIVVSQSGFTGGSQSFGNGLGGGGQPTTNVVSGISIANAGGSQAHNNLQPYIVLKYCKKN